MTSDNINFNVQSQKQLTFFGFATKKVMLVAKSQQLYFANEKPDSI